MLQEAQPAQAVEPQPGYAWGANDRSVINEEPVEDEESCATQESCHAEA